MMNKTRIEMKDTPIDTIMKLSEGNPGAATVLSEMFIKNKGIDPDDFWGGFGPLFSLDMHGIYGSKIWMLYKDVCKGNIVDTLGVLRAVQLGYLPESTLLNAIENYGEGINVSEMVKQVKERLPNFGAAE